MPVSGSETSFWKRAQELEVISDAGDAILYAQTKLSDSLDLIEVTHARFLELNAGYARLCPTDSAASMALAGLTKTQRELKDAVAAYWDWKFILLGLEGPLPSYAGDFAAQLAQAKADSDLRFGSMESSIRDLKSEFGELKDLLLAGRDGALPLNPPTNPIAPPQSDPLSYTSKPIRVPAPRFDGTKGGTKVNTWLEQFDDYAPIMQISPGDLVANASLCLTGRAAEQWAVIKKSLAQRGKDPRDFYTF